MSPAATIFFSRVVGGVTLPPLCLCMLTPPDGVVLMDEKIECWEILSNGRADDRLCDLDGFAVEISCHLKGIATGYEVAHYSAKPWRP